MKTLLALALVMIVLVAVDDMIELYRRRKN